MALVRLCVRLLRASKPDREENQARFRRLGLPCRESSSQKCPASRGRRTSACAGIAAPPRPHASSRAVRFSVPPFLPSYLPSFLPSLIRSFISSFVRSLARSLFRPCSRADARSQVGPHVVPSTLRTGDVLTRLLCLLYRRAVNPLTRSLARSLARSLVRSLAPASCVRSLTYCSRSRPRPARSPRAGSRVPLQEAHRLTHCPACGRRRSAACAGIARPPARARFVSFPPCVTLI